MSQLTIIQSKNTTTRLLKVTQLLKVEFKTPLSSVQLQAGLKILKFLLLCVRRRQNLKVHIASLIIQSQVSSRRKSCYNERFIPLKDQIIKYLIQAVIARSYRKYLVRKQLSHDTIPCCIYWSEKHSNVHSNLKPSTNRDVKLVGSFTQRKWEVSAYLMIMSR